MRAQVNEAGAMKNFFVDGASLSDPQSDVPDSIARRFLKRQAQLFALSDAGVDSLKLEKEDNDRGTSFLDYSQTMEGIKVFEGNVKVVVNGQGEVINVREGFLVNGQRQRHSRRGLQLDCREQLDVHQHHGRRKRHGQWHCLLLVASNTGTTSRTGTLTIAGKTFTVSQAGTSGGGTELLTNNGFESGTPPWVISGQVTYSTGAYPHSGVAYMIVNGVDSTTGTLYQQVTIPSGTVPTLTFYLNITTNEAAGSPIYDRLFIEVRSTTGTLLGTLATFSNQNAGTAGVYTLRGPYNLSAWAGQTVRIQFRGTNDITLPTSFRVDDVSVK